MQEKRHETRELSFFGGMMLIILALVFISFRLTVEAKSNEEAVPIEETTPYEETTEAVAVGPGYVSVSETEIAQEVEETTEQVVEETIAVGPAAQVAEETVEQSVVAEVALGPGSVTVEETETVQETETEGYVLGFDYSEEDYQVLCRIVEAEVGSCDEKMKIIVTNAICNRVKSPNWPNTITGVVFQKGQFSPVSNGAYYNCTVQDSTIKAVNKALAGEDYSQGAEYFMVRAASAKKNVAWFDSHLTFLFKYGTVEFFK